MTPKLLLDYFRQPGFMIGIMVFISVTIAYTRITRENSWKGKVLGGFAVFGMLGSIWFLSGFW